MSIDRHAGETDEFYVYSESGSVYRIYLITETCDCLSVTYQDGACKHQRRVEMAFGQRDVPDLEKETDVEMMIAAREQYTIPSWDSERHDRAMFGDRPLNIPKGITGIGERVSEDWRRWWFWWTDAV